MPQENEALAILNRHQIHFRASNRKGFKVLLSRNQVDSDLLRRLGFRVSHMMGSVWIVSYKGWRFGLIE
jgi:hypothetical protein